MELRKPKYAFKVKCGTKFTGNSKVREMQNSSEVFKSNFDYYQRVAHKKLSKTNVLLDFPTSRFPAGGPF